jgi:uncharacterized membrane protein
VPAFCHFRRQLARRSWRARGACDTTAAMKSLRALSGHAPALLAATGLLASVGLELLHLQTHLRPDRSAFCAVGERVDCVAVAASPEAIFLGLPWALYGLAGFAALLVAALRRSRWLLPLSLLAAATSLTLLGVSILRVASVCLLCELAHLSAVALAVLAVRRRASLGEGYAHTDGQAQILAAPAGLLVALHLVVPPYWAAFSYEGEPPRPTGLTSEGLPYLGAAEPKLTVWEFTDYSCPHCKSASARSLRLVAENRGLRLVRRQHPRTPCRERNPRACVEVRAAVCAAEQGRFWQADRWLFAFTTRKGKLDVEKFARDVKLDRDALERCLPAKETYARADAEYRAARALKLTEVPSYVVEGSNEPVAPERLADLVAERAR